MVEMHGHNSPRVIFPLSDCKKAQSHGIVSVLSSCDFVNELNERELTLCFMSRADCYVAED